MVVFLRVVVGVEALAVFLGADEGGFVEAHDGVVAAPGPDAGVVLVGAFVEVSGDVVLDESAVGGPGDDAVAADVLDVVVADDDVQRGEPAAAVDEGALGGDGAAIDLPDDVAFDGEAVEAGWRRSCRRCAR